MAFTNIIDIIYPVGSIYQSMSATSPATLFGGTWAAINTFLYGQNTPGNTGGQNSFTIIEENLPKGLNLNAATSFTGQIVSDAIDTNSYWSNTQLTATNPCYIGLTYGKSQAIDNRPSYTTCCIWKRTA